MRNCTWIATIIVSKIYVLANSRAWSIYVSWQISYMLFHIFKDTVLMLRHFEQGLNSVLQSANFGIRRKPVYFSRLQLCTILCSHYKRFFSDLFIQIHKKNTTVKTHAIKAPKKSSKTKIYGMKARKSWNSEKCKVY
jgi:hypothetical protein